MQQKDSLNLVQKSNFDSLIPKNIGGGESKN